MQAQFVEAFMHLRDHAKPLTQQDAADLAKVRAPAPPSKAHLKRLARHRDEIKFIETPRPIAEANAATLRLRAQLDFHKRVVAQLGGSRVIADVDAPVGHIGHSILEAHAIKLDLQVLHNRAVLQKRAVDRRLALGGQLELFK